MEYTGNLFESQFIGEADTDNPKYRQALEKAKKEEEKAGMKDGYIRFRKAMELARQSQTYDPTNPNKPFARDIRIAFQDLLKLETPEEMDLVRFFTAVGTPLDKLHGVDGFLEYLDPKDRKRYFATFDLTANPQKRVYKSDIIVVEKDLPDPDLRPKEYLEKINELAKQALVKILARQVQEQKMVLDRPSK